MKKIEIGTEFPRHFQSLYSEEFSLFSHLETASSIPSVLFAITTWKENGRPNICFHAWSSFYLLPRLEQLLRGTGFISRCVRQSLSAHAHLCQYPA